MCVDKSIPVLNFQILQHSTKNYVLIFFGKVQIIIAPVGFKFMTYRFVINALIHCAMLLRNNIGKENIFIIPEVLSISVEIRYKIELS